MDAKAGVSLLSATKTDAEKFIMNPTDHWIKFL